MSKMILFLLLLVVFSINTNAQYYSIDSSFGLNGMADFGFGGVTNNDMPYDIVMQPDGKIITAGESDAPDGIYIAIARLFPGGELDSAGFGIDGRIYTHFVAMDHANAVALQSDGKIVAVGDEAASNAGSATIQSIYRFNSDGSLDTTFAGTGYVALRFDGVSSGSFYGVSVQPDGKILAAGSETGNANGGTFGFGTMRFLTNGNLDTTYGVSGKSTIPASLLYNWVGCAFLADGGIVMASAGYDGNYKYFLTKMDSLGNRDTTFGTNGIVEVTTQNNYSTRLALTSDDKILMGGTTLSADSHFQFTVFRFLSDGTLDTSFASGGRFDIHYNDDYFKDLIVDNEGRILLIGETGGYGVLERLTPDGILDTTFAPEGRIIQSLNNNSGSSFFTSGVFLPDEKILAAGYDGVNFAVAKYSNGVTGVKGNNIAPGNFILNQNFPNPFNPATRISFKLPSQSKINLSVYNILGEKVGTLLNKTLQAGDYSINFNAGSLASGIYIYSIEAESLTDNSVFHLSKKMILLK